MTIQKRILLEKTFERLNQRWNLQREDIEDYLDDEVLIPVTIFSKDLSPLETVVKYLRENKRKPLSKIAKLLKRASSNIYNAYRKSQSKHPSALAMGPTDYYIPLSKLRRKGTVLENVVFYLKQDLNFRQIGKLLQRNERTIWTVYNRKKN
jgi:hypothetical protein